MITIHIQGNIKKNSAYIMLLLWKSYKILIFASLNYSQKENSITQTGVGTNQEQRWQWHLAMQ